MGRGNCSTVRWWIRQGGNNVGRENLKKKKKTQQIANTKHSHSNENRLNHVEFPSLSLKILEYLTRAKVGTIE